MKKQHHYFASCAFAWATAETRKEAIEKMIAYAGRQDIKKMTNNLHKKGEQGAYFWTCRVMVPSDHNYQINFYSPQGVKKEAACHHHVTYITAKAVAYTSSVDVERQVSLHELDSEADSQAELDLKGDVITFPEAPF